MLNNIFKSIFTSSKVKKVPNNHNILTTSIELFQTLDRERERERGERERKRGEIETGERERGKESLLIMYTA